MKQVVVINGGSDFRSYEEFISYIKSTPVDISEFLPQQVWRDRLPEELGDNYRIFIPEMPNRANAHFEEWKIWFEKMTQYLIDDVILIGHSLGALFLAKYLSENTFPHRIKATILISAPYDDEGLEPPLGDFAMDRPLDGLATQGGDIYLVHAEDDPIVPFAHAKKYLEQLPSAHLVDLKTGKHFIQPEFPELVELIKKIV